MSEAPNPADTPTPTPTPSPSSGTDTQAGPAGGGNDPWYSTLPDDLKGDPNVIRYENSEAAVRALVAATKKLGVPADQLLRTPTDPNDKSQYEAIYKALGAPDKPDGYQIDLGQGATDADKAVAQAFAAHMHAEGPFPPQAVAAAAAFWQKQVADQTAADLQAAADATKAAETELRTAWGAAYDQNKAAIGKLLADHGGPDLVKELDASGFGDSPKLAQFLAKLVDKMAEPGPTADGQNADTPKVMTPGQAKAARLALEGDPVKSRALHDAAHPQHKAVVDERTRYFELEAAANRAA